MATGTAHAVSAPVAQGAPFRIDESSGTILAAAVAEAPDGTLAVVYQDQNLAIWARRVDAAGNPLGAPVQVSTHGSAAPRVAINSSDNFAVAWDSYSGGNGALYAQVYSGSGAPLGGPFQVDSGANALQPQFPGLSSEPPVFAMAIDGQNRVAVTWAVADGAMRPGQPGIPTKLVAQRFAVDGTPVDATPFTVSSGSSGLPVRISPAIAMAPAGQFAGQFVVAWIGTWEYDFFTGLGEQQVQLPSAEVRFQRYSADAVAQGSAGSPGLQEGSTSANSLAMLGLAINASGQFALSWAGIVDEKNIYTQRFTADGLPASGRLQYAFADSATIPTINAVGIDAAGDCVTTWLDQPGATDAAPLLDGLNGISPASEFSAQAWGVSLPGAQGIAMGSDGGFVIVYQGSAGGLYGQIYKLQ
jgi:hypothetical protein